MQPRYAARIEAQAQKNFFNSNTKRAQEDEVLFHSKSDARIFYDIAIR
jgi:hypothetical protein